MRTILTVETWTAVMRMHPDETCPRCGGYLTNKVRLVVPEPFQAL